MSLAQNHADPQQVEQACRYFLNNQLAVSYQSFKQQLHILAHQSRVDDPLPLSHHSREFVRDLGYFVKNNS